MQRERRRWSIVSKSPRGMYLLDADLKAEMRREGGKQQPQSLFSTILFLY